MFDILGFVGLVYLVFSALIIFSLLFSGENAETILGYGIFYPLWLIKKAFIGGFNILAK